ncbi:hypothetical protein [Sphingosinicella sp. LY1275]|uniref:hypothetical protein n=1 Tax=Sphingosinicella sp. LY1275 TaxID=3095379 RepID=UPI002ADED5F5|nr:hypothetical protein [Sphingosinicella sp. LY1275]MEA1014886.1 hypothetical protein [Sphingosinicella sp. LY1275]
MNASREARHAAADQRRHQRPAARGLRADRASRPHLFEEIVSRQWASATFTGARHDLTFRLEGPNAWASADSFLDNLESAEFALRGHILADIALVSEERFADPAGEPRTRLRIEALTVEDA